MIANLIGKGAGLILQIVVVVAAVLLFSYFDPFGFLTPKKKTLKNTPVQVRSIKEIGQMITAEYYGEVIASLDEVVKTREEAVVIEFVTITDDLHEDFLDAIETLSDTELSNNKKETIYNSFKTQNKSIVENQEYEAYIYYINEKLRGNKYNKKDLTKQLSESSKQALIRRLYLNKKDYRVKLENLETDEFKQEREKKITGQNKKKYKRSRLVIIGRGGVKAGFDFRNFTEKNFKYHPSRKTIHFVGLKPEILSATINPWFIPEEGVEGFEFLIAERGARLKPEYTMMVKRRCLDKLKYQAEEKEILKRAKENAETNLKAFFSLMLNEEVRSVTFHTDLLDYTLTALLEDSVIRNEELVTIDHTLLDFYNSNKKNQARFQKMDFFVDSLTRSDLIINNESFKLHSFSSLLFQIVRNRMIDSADLVRIGERKNALLDSAWHSQLFVDMELKTQLDSLKKEKEFHDSINADLDKLIDDLKWSYTNFEMEFDTTYFNKPASEADKLKKFIAETDAILRKK